MSRLFISHSTKDNIAAIAFKQWLGANGWPDEDVFLDLDSIGAGERWKEALRNANFRCEAVILLASPYALASPECLAEVRKAEDLGKEIIVVLLHDLQVDDRRLDSYKDRQIVDLATPPQNHVEKLDYRGEHHEIRFNGNALARVKDFLIKHGITPERFAWPARDKPNAEPFPGLSAFTEDDAGIFFGRDSDILRGLDKLRVMRRNGRPRLLVIQAASGAGKSSYMRAGLWPRLYRDSDFAPVATLRPAQGILTGPEGLGRKFAQRLSRPNSPISPGEIHAQLMAHDHEKAALDFIHLMSLAAIQAHEQRRTGDPDARPPALVLAIDQAEELFAADDRTESERFLSLLANLMQKPPSGVEQFCLFTIRADGATRLFQAIADIKLEVPETLPLLPLPQSSYRDIVLKPLEVLARRGQSLKLTPALADRLIADATGADALPLLAFTISHLYREFGATGTLSVEQYNAMGGVAGSIDMALKQALAKPDDAPVIPVTKEEQLAQLRSAFIPWLARIDPHTGVPMRRVARIDEFPRNSRAMVERLIEARLLAVDRRSGANVVEVAHESLLRQWSVLTAWLQSDADSLKLLEDVERAAAEWERRGKLDAWIDHRAERLYSAEMLSAREDFQGRFSNNVADYLAACRAHESPAFRQAGIDLLPLGLERAGLDTRTFPWPPASDPKRAPFRGLSSLETDEAGIFFGRDRDIVRVLERIRSLVESGSDNFLIILGASGIGKSSFLSAGLWPRLARYSIDFVLLPIVHADASDPTKELAAAFSDAFRRLGAPCKQNQEYLEPLLNGKSGVSVSELINQIISLAKSSIKTDHANPTIILPIDQLQHIFIGAQNNIDIFRNLLADILVSNKRILVIATMRSEHYHLLESDPRLSAAKLELFNLPPLRQLEMLEVICRPAALTAVRYDSGELPKELAEQAAQEANLLPLLAFLLEGMWMQMVARGDGILRLPVGGLAEVVSERAESFVAMHRGAEDQIRDLFIRKLLVMRENDEPIPRPARRSEFSEDEWRLVCELADYPYRLLVLTTPASGQTYAEVASDAIFRSWPRFREWLYRERQFLVWRAKIETVYREWQVAPSELKKDALLTGLRLAEAESWLLQRANDLDAGIRQYIHLSKRRGSRRQRWVAASAIFFALISISATGAAYQAFRERQIAKAQTIEAQAQRKIAEVALRSANTANLRTGSVISPEGRRLLALDPNGQVRVIDLASDRVIGVIVGNGEITSAAFSPNGARIATGGTTKEVEIWDAATLSQIAVLRGATDAIRSLAFSPDGVLLASGGDDNVARVWSVQTGHEQFVIQVSAPVVALAFSPDGKSLIVSTSNGTLYAVDSATGRSTIVVPG